MLTVSRACKVQKLQKNRGKEQPQLALALADFSKLSLTSSYFSRSVHQSPCFIFKCSPLSDSIFECVCVCVFESIMYVCLKQRSHRSASKNVSSCFNRRLLSYYLWHSSAMQGHSHSNAHSHQEETHSLALFLFPTTDTPTLSHTHTRITNAHTHTLKDVD